MLTVALIFKQAIEKKSPEDNAYKEHYKRLVYARKNRTNPSPKKKLGSLRFCCSRMTSGFIRVYTADMNPFPIGLALTTFALSQTIANIGNHFFLMF